MSPRHRIPEPTREARAAAEALRPLVAGEVSLSPLQRWLYSTDASSYRVVPDAVLVAGSVDDLHAVMEVAARYGVPVVARGAASSCAGQAIGPGIAVDCFRLGRVLEIDPEARTARVEPGVVQAALNRAAAGARPGVRTRHLHRRPGDHRRHGGQQLVRLALDRVRGDPRQGRSRSAPSSRAGRRSRSARARASDLRGGLHGRGGGRARRRRSRPSASAYRRAIAEDYPRTRRCTTGYDLRTLLEPRPRLARLLAGSEGTLGLFTEVEVQLDPRPALRVGAALTFPALRAALEANLLILETGPSAVELVDLVPLRAAPNLAAYRSMAPLLDGDERAMLTVEYQGSEEEARAGLSRLRGRRRRAGRDSRGVARRPGGHGGGGGPAARRDAAAHGRSRGRPADGLRGRHRRGARSACPTTSTPSRRWWRRSARAARSPGTPRPGARTCGRCST